MKRTDLGFSIALTVTFAVAIGRLVEHQSFGVAAGLSVAFIGVMILCATAELSRASGH